MARTLRVGPIFFVLFSLPFAAVGVGMAIWMSSGVLACWKMKNWQETPARIVRAKLECHSDSDGSTYQATAEYTYKFGSRQYTGKRVGVTGGSDNIGSYQQDVHRQLSAHQTSGRPFRCYVNPNRPSEAVLFRDLRWEMVAFQAVFAEAFGAAGFGLLTFALVAWFDKRGSKALAAAHPDEPWLARKDWAEGKINSSTKTSAIVLFVVTLYWNAISVPLAAVFPHDEVAKANWIPLLVLIFPAVGAILLLCLVVKTLRWRKYGRSVFEMASVPGVIGGQLAGVVRVSKKVEPDDGFRLTLHCIQTIAAGDSSSEKSVWQDEQVIGRELSQSNPENSAIPVLFQIPYECLPTDLEGENRPTYWRLTVSAKTPGLDYSATFDVPVFKTPDSNPNFVVDRSLIAGYAAADNPERDLRDAGIIKTASPSGEGFRLVFPMGRTIGMGFVFLLAVVIFGGAPVLMYYLAAPWFVMILFGVVFGAVALICLFAVVDTWFYRSVVDVSPAGLRVVGGLFGMGGEKQIMAANIEKIEPKSRMSSDGALGARVWYDIDVSYRPSKKTTIGKRIQGKRLVDSVIRQIKQGIEIDDESEEATEK